MEWFKVPVSFPRDVRVLRAGEAAMDLFWKALAYAAEHETGGLVHSEVLPTLAPLKGPQRAAALVTAGLWTTEPEGWRISAWGWDDGYQADLGAIEAKRAAGRERAARHRARSNGVGNARSNGVRNGVTNAHLTQAEVEGEVEEEAAAAATRERRGSSGGRDRPDLPQTVAIFADRIRARTRFAGLRFDQLRPAQLTLLKELIELHGDDRLVDVAETTCRPTPPVSVAAFLGTWASLPPPGLALHVVRPRRCTKHDTTLSPSGTCTSCEADRKAAR